jgi:hypothetical protein
MTAVLPPVLSLAPIRGEDPQAQNIVEMLDAGSRDRASPAPSGGRKSSTSSTDDTGPRSLRIVAAAADTAFS